MATLDSQIDELYAGPLESFVASRNALAKSLTGSERTRIKSLEKPNVIAWAANQTYWHARDVYDRLLKAGAQLRSAQVGALERKSSDVRAAMLRHRDAVGQAVAAATKIAGRTGAQPDKDRLRALFDALSTQEKPAEPHGRITKPPQPAGFASLARLSIASAPAPDREAERRKAAEERRQAEEARRLRSALKDAEEEVARLRKDEARARGNWERTKTALDKAETHRAELLERARFLPD